MSIRTRLLLLITFATLTPAVVGGLMFLDYRKLQIAEARFALENATRQIAQSLSDRVSSTAQLHYGLSRARDFDTKDRAACSKFLADVLEAHPQYTGILTINPDGQLFCDSLRTGRTLNLLDRAYFQSAMNSATPLAVEPVFGRLTGRGVLQIAYGVRDSANKSKFVLLASLDLDKYIQARSQPLPGLKAQFALIDTQGTILAWQPGDGSMRGKRIADSKLRQITPESSGVSVRENIDIDGQSRIWASSTLPDFESVGLRVLVGVSENDLLASANKRLHEALAVLAAVWLVVFAGAWALAELAIRRQAARVIATVARFCGGDFSARIRAPYPRGELGDLMGALDEAFELMDSQRREIEKLNTGLERSVGERTAQLQASVKELESFTYSVSHDLRAPLRAIYGFSHLLREDYAGKLDAEGMRRLGIVCANSEKMGKLIDDLLEFSRLGRRAMAGAVLDMDHLVADVIREIRQQGGKTPDITVAALPRAPGDAALIRQVWINLLSNAIKFSAGSAPPVVGIDGYVSGEECVYRVKDNGAGFDMRYYGKLFGVFQRLHSDAEFSGTGVGLAIVQRIVLRHGGRVWAEGETGAGASFYFALPRAAQDAAAN